MLMRRHLVVAAAFAVALALPALALAKGPSSARLFGPGIDSLAVAGQGEMGPGTPLGALVDSGGFFAQMYGQSPDPTSKARPKAALGPRYRVVYIVPGPNGIRSRVLQDVYPYARPVPYTFMKAGQSFWGYRKAHGGWFRASAALKQALVDAGLPADAPTTAR
jgi:hypothetical protein